MLQKTARNRTRENTEAKKLEFPVLGAAVALGIDVKRRSQKALSFEAEIITPKGQSGATRGFVRGRRAQSNNL